ncbi:endothelin-1 isoform X1 [Gadus morhua]|uniref:Endothelin 1 n=1 Tax=Gadus morhua TaxID=8049 RepID=A0A8C5AXH0_GADMO|nr:endothelin-1 isoform X1 [Gadus morhua]
MDLRAVTSLLSVMLAAVLNTVVSAPASEVPAASLVSHVRNKRCSCATFLDHECVYFCHLDIIWVNTPERIVSYGLGNMPRRRRSAGVPPAKSHGGARCRCLKGNDSACNNFCQPEHQLRQNKTSLGKKIRRAEGERCSGAGCARTPSMKRRTNRGKHEENVVAGSAARRGADPRRPGGVEDEEVEEGGGGGARRILDSLGSTSSNH